MRYRTTRALALGLVATATVPAIWLWSCSLSRDDESEAPTLVGRDSCIECHAEQHAAWLGSHHDLAMQTADSTTVLGNFDDATFSHAGATTRFSRDGDRFLVTTDGPDGALSTFEIDYTFGVEPLQQYLVRFPDGRLQALSICWDARPASKGGQRWFHLYPEERIDHRDPLHWTAPSQNWNHMCAECHSTGLVKNYRDSTDSFETVWNEIDVSCESCHGAGSRHVEWARGGSRDNDPGRGLPVAVPGRDRRWQRGERDSVARLASASGGRALLETCAPCHSRRAAIQDDPHHAGAFLDGYIPSLLEEGLYFPDGQILEEVYVFGSFLQSKMYASGVDCADCHDPHSLELVVEGNALCGQCHAPGVFDAPEHHHHEPGSAGAQCVSCHMPSRNYMVIDARRDHSFRVPRPDLTTELGVPNACEDCHADRSSGWAARAVREWGGKESALDHEFAAALAAGQRAEPGADAALTRVLQSEAPSIARATALTLLSGREQERLRREVMRARSDPDPLLRLAAPPAAERLAPADRWQLLEPLLADPLLAVRIEAGRVLADMPRESLDESQRARLEAAVQEYRESQILHADRGEAWVNLGVLETRLGREAHAEVAYRKALVRAPWYVPASVNLADLYRMQDRDAEGESVLRAALDRTPDTAVLEYALGLTLVRLGRHSEAVEWLAKAHRHEPDNARFAYVYAIALDGEGRHDEAVAALQRGLRHRPRDRDLLMAIVSIASSRGDRALVDRYREELADWWGDDPQAAALLRTVSG